MNREELKRSIGIIALILFVSFLIYNYFTQGFMHDMIHSDVEDIRNFIESFGSFAILAYFIIVIIEVIVAPIPSILLYSVGGILFGGTITATVALIGNVIGAIIAFYIAKFFLHDAFEKKVSPKKRKQFHSMVDKYGVYAIFFLRANPLTSSDIFSYLAGLTNMNVWKFALATGLGLLPLVLIQSYFGSEILASSSLLTTGSIIFTIIFIIGGIAAYVFSKNHQK